MEPKEPDLSKPKILVVVGSTGVGKTKLGVALAKKFNGEVVSCDSMQIYKQVNIATNKVTVEEADGIPHHMIDIIEPTDTSFNVSKFIAASRSVIDDILSRNKVPILVGGTHQYIEGLLVSNQYLTNSEHHASEAEKIGDKVPPCTVSDLLEMINKEPLDLNSVYERVKYEHEDHLQQILEQVPREKLFQVLERVDPARALKLHPNDYRKIIRSLHVFLTTGEVHSKQLEHEHLRLYDACILWPKAKMELLGERLDERIDQMVQRGLVNEVLFLRDLFAQKGVPIEFTKGVFQSIGYKEFAPYLEKTSGKSRDEIINDESLHEVLAECLKQLKSNTRYYARRQTAWIKNRLASVTQTSIYCLNATELTNWDSNVCVPAINICKAFLENSAIEWSKILSANESFDKEEWKKYECISCNKTLNGQHEWEVHVGSKSHKKRKASLKKREMNELKRQKMNDTTEK